MAKTTNEFRLNLLSKIRQADTTYAIERYIITATKTLASKKVNGHLIDRFLDRSIADLQADLSDPSRLLIQEKVSAGLKFLRVAKSNLIATVR
jgi:hypothetical protein